MEIYSQYLMGKLTISMAMFNTELGTILKVDHSFDPSPPLPPEEVCPRIALELLGGGCV